MVSIGGWTLSDNFPPIASNAAKRAIFAHECNRLLQFYKFDGIDIDWEYPGYVDHSGTTADKVNYTLFLRQIHDSISALGITTGKTYKLSACFGASAANASNIEWANIVPVLDMINLMTYDFFGAWDCLANHNSPLYAPASGDPSFNLHSAFSMLVSTYGVPASKINLGIGFYGRSQTGATALHAATSCNANTTTFSADDGSPLYYNIMDKMSLFDQYWDNTAKVPYLLGKSGGLAAGTFVSYDNKLSVAYKAQYIKNNNARGAIIWEITGDYLETIVGSGVIAGTPLLDTLNSVFCSITTNIESSPPNEISSIVVYPNPNTGILNVSLKSNITVTLMITDINGSTILKQTISNSENKINMQNFAKGIYFLRIESPTSTRYQKIVKD
jgi:chitinase